MMYVTLPDNVSSVLGLRIGRKYRVAKYIYGLPDSGLAYYNRYSELLIEDGYKRTRSDPCLFVRVTSEERTYVRIHVDDTFICSNERKFVDRFCDCLRKNFKITINEQVSEYLGIKMEDQEDGSVFITQPKLLNTLFQEYEGFFSKSLRRKTPQSSKALLPIGEGDEPVDATEYLHLLGILIYLTKSRPEIATAVSFGVTHADTYMLC